MELLGRTKSKITKDENDENGLYLEITEAALVHCNIVNDNYHMTWFENLVYISFKEIVWSIIRCLT